MEASDDGVLCDSDPRELRFSSEPLGGIGADQELGVAVGRRAYLAPEHIIGVQGYRKSPADHLLMSGQL
jgi:hypothetical protein